MQFTWLLALALVVFVPDVHSIDADGYVDGWCPNDEVIGYPDRTVKYATKEEAEAACGNESTCTGVYDYRCRKGEYFLCDGVLKKEWVMQGSCVKSKEDF